MSAVAVASPSIERFWSRVDRSAPPPAGHPEMGSCWLWTLGTDGQGYGCATVDGRQDRAHRHAYRLAIGPIPDGLVIDHLCRVTLCLRPDHLEAVTRAENVRRGVPSNSKKSHCPAGHAYAVHGYTIPTRPRARYCQECNRLRSAVRRDAETLRQEIVATVLAMSRQEVVDLAAHLQGEQ